MNWVEQMTQLTQPTHTTQTNKKKDTNQSNTYWEEQREYFKQKTLAFKELKKKRQIELMKNELEKGTKI